MSQMTPSEIAGRIAELEKDKDHWKANHANVTDLKRKAEGIHTARYAALEAKLKPAEVGLEDIEDAANSFCDGSGDVVAGEVRIRVRATLRAIKGEG